MEYDYEKMARPADTLAGAGAEEIDGGEPEKKKKTKEELKKEKAERKIPRPAGEQNVLRIFFRNIFMGFKNGFVFFKLVLIIKLQVGLTWRRKCMQCTYLDCHWISKRRNSR